jgi:hypothetical protein
MPMLIKSFFLWMLKLWTFCIVSWVEVSLRTLYWKNTRNIWHVLEVTHEGTNQVKESKIDMLVHQYELFKMLQNEYITSMITRMTTITNSLDVLGSTYTNADIVSKTFRSLSKTWERKVATIWEANDNN